MLAEQTLVNGAVLTVDAVATDAALAGIVFSVLLIARAPLQLFQAIQGTLLPHLATLQATAGRAEFGRAIRLTLKAIAAFAVTGGVSDGARIYDIVFVVVALSVVVQGTSIPLVARALGIPMRDAEQAPIDAPPSP